MWSRTGISRTALAFLWLLFSSPVSTGVKPGKRPLLQNGGFEKGLTGWKTNSLKLIDDPLEAHRGDKCVRGEVVRRKQGRDLMRTLELRREQLYRLEIWARSDSRSRLTVWLHAGDERKVIANWKWVPTRWQRYRVNFTVAADGPATIRIVAPSSFWAPVGRMWIDDVSLVEQQLPPQIEVSAGAGFGDFPAMAKSGPGSAWAAWISFSDGHDTLQAARLKVKGSGLVLEKTFQVTGGPGARILDPALAAADDGSAWLVYAAEENKNWDIFAVRLTAGGPGERVRVTKTPAVDVHPAAAVGGDTLWVAWESNREESRRHVYLTAVRGGVAGRPLRLSSSGSNNYQPAAAADGPDEVTVAWHSFRENNYDLYLRTFSEGSPGPEERLTRAPGIDREVRLLIHEKKLWLAWEHAAYSGYFLGKSTTKRVQVARLENRRLRSPVGVRYTRLFEMAEKPQIALDGKGRLWVAALVPRDRNSGWDTLLWSYRQDGWSAPRVLSRRKGRSRRPGLIAFDGFTAVGYQGDDLPGRWLSVKESVKGTSGIFLAVVEHGDEPAGEIELGPYTPPGDGFEAAGLRERMGEERRGWEAEYNGKQLRLLFGDLHEHTDLSVCDRTRDDTPDQTYQMMRDVARYDFGGLTDHGKCFNDYLWSYNGKRVRANHDPGRFLTLLAQEWTSTFERRTEKYPYGYYGHRNLFFSDPFFPKWYNAALDIKPAGLRAQLQKDRADYVLIPHQLADTGNVPVDWDFHDEKAEPVAEIFQFRGSYECDGCPRQANLARAQGHFLQDAWARGIVVGVIASPDHEGGLGKAAVYAEEFTRQAILDALRKRRAYGTTGAKIFLDVRVNGLFMGEVGDPPGKKPVKVEVKVDCPGPIRVVEILRDNQVVFNAQGKDQSMQVAYVDDPPPKGPAYYYVRVIQKDEEMAWSSPIWLGRKDLK